MGASYVQTSFLGGQWSPLAQGRMDHPRYPTALGEMQNCYPLEEGAAVRRPGNVFAATTRSGVAGRLLPFAFESATPYNIELTDGHMRMFLGTALATDPDSQVVSSISAANPAVVTLPAAAVWVTGDQAQFSFGDVLTEATMRLLAHRQFSLTMLTSTTFALNDAVTGLPVDGSTLGWTSGLTLTMAKISDVATPYLSASWGNTRLVQSKTTGLLLNPLYAPQTLTAVPGSGTLAATFSIAPSQFKDGPYLDPFSNSTITPDALTGLVNLTLGFAAYDATKAYAMGDYVSSAASAYVSIANANLAHTPASSPAYWAPSSFGAVIGANGFTATDIGRHVRIFSEPPLWVTGTSYTAGNVVSFNNAYWTALLSMTGATPAAGDVNPNQPGNLTTTWAVNATGARWTWGVITALATSGLIDPAAGTLIDTAGTTRPTAAFDGVTIQDSSGCTVVGEQTYIGKNFSVFGAQAVTSAVIYPASSGWLNLSAQSVTISLYASHTPPANSTNGTRLATASFGRPDTAGVKTLLSSDPTTLWEYVWLAVDATGGAIIYISELQFFTGSNPPGSGAQVQLRGLPLLYTTPARTWRLGTYNATDPVWPASGCYHEGRFWLGGAVKNRFDASVSNDPFNFAPTGPTGAVGDANAISYTLNSKQLNSIVWMKPGLQGIVAGTVDGEWLISAPTPGSMSPTNIHAVLVTEYGCAAVEPKATGLTTVFVQKYGRQVIEYLTDAYSGKFCGPNLSEFAKDLTQSGVVEIAYQRELSPIIWARCGDGSLIGATYKRISMLSSQPPEFIAWHKHPLGSGRLVESICVGPSADGGAIDSLAMVTNDPETGIRHVEVAAPLFDEDTAQDLLWPLDDAVVPSSGTTVAGSIRFDGLWHLNGQTVTVFAALVDCGDFVVANGSVTVPLGSGFGIAAGLFTDRWMTQLSAIGEATPFEYACDIDQGRVTIPVVIGFTFTTQGQLLRPAGQPQTGAQNGPGFGKLKTQHKFAALLHRTQGVKFGTKFPATYPANFATDGGRAYTATELYSGVWRDIISDDPSLDSQICWEVTRPYPCSIAALGGFITTQDV